MVVAVLVDEFTSGKARACVHTLAPIYVRDEDRRGGSEAELGRRSWGGEKGRRRRQGVCAYVWLCTLGVYRLGTYTRKHTAVQREHAEKAARKLKKATQALQHKGPLDPLLAPLTHYNTQDDLVSKISGVFQLFDVDDNGRNFAKSSSIVILMCECILLLMRIFDRAIDGARDSRRPLQVLWHPAVRGRLD